MGAFLADNPAAAPRYLLFGAIKKKPNYHLESQVPSQQVSFFFERRGFGIASIIYVESIGPSEHLPQKMLPYKAEALGAYWCP